MAKKLYTILELDNEQADEATIRKAYLRLAKKYHPDKNPNGEELFKQIKEAYSILIYITKRKQYDAGQINEKGEPIVATMPTVSPQPTPSPSYRRPQPDKPSRPHSHSFFCPRPTHYYFFNSHEEARAFQPRQLRTIPVFIYVTPTPLDALLSLISRDLLVLKPTPNKARQTAEGPIPFAHLKGVNAQSPHVFVNSPFPDRMEKVIAHLMAQAVLLELINQPSLSQPRPTSFRM